LWVAIGRPPAAVFAFLVDVQEHEPIPRRAAIRMTKIPAGPTAAGTRWHEQVRLMPGWWMTVDSVVTDIDEPAVLGMDFRSSWCTGHLTYTHRGHPRRQHLAPAGDAAATVAAAAAGGLDGRPAAAAPVGTAGRDLGGAGIGLTADAAKGAAQLARRGSSRTGGGPPRGPRRLPH
jgi:hypothetical protein